MESSQEKFCFWLFNEIKRVNDNSIKSVPRESEESAEFFERDGRKAV